MTSHIPKDRGHKYFRENLKPQVPFWNRGIWIAMKHRKPFLLTKSKTFNLFCTFKNATLLQCFQCHFQQRHLRCTCDSNSHEVCPGCDFVLGSFLDPFSQPGQKISVCFTLDWCGRPITSFFPFAVWDAREVLEHSVFFSFQKRPGQVVSRTILTEANVLPLLY